MKYHLILLLFLGGLASYAQRGDDVVVKKTMKAMGTYFEICVVAPSEEIGYAYIDEAHAEIRRIDALLSSWKPTSETARVNENAGIRPVAVSGEVFDLITRAKKISQLTDGAFDITYASMEDIWKFDGTMDHIPTDAEIQASVGAIGYGKIALDAVEHTVFLEDLDMRIGFGAIAKGYAADRAKELLVAKGVKGGMVNASGDLATWGTRLTGEKWMMGVADPKDERTILSWLPIEDAAMASSSDFEKYVFFKGEKYSHIIDPRTGYPTKGVHSVSIFAKKAELCDALATAIFILGSEEGLRLIDRLEGVEMVLVDDQKRIFKSSGLRFKTKEFQTEK